EAMACGVPVVGADVGGQRELVTPDCGVLVERGSEREEAARYARALAELLAEARRGVRIVPGEAPSLEAARAAAASAVGALARSRAAVRLAATRSGRGLRERGYLVARRLASPLFAVAARRGWTWVFRLGDRARRALLR